MQFIVGFIVLIAVIGTSGGVGEFLSSALGGLLVLAIGASALVLVGNLWGQATEPIKQAKRQAALAKCNPLIESHTPELIRKRQQLLVDRGYGIKNTKRWEEEKVFFVQNVLARKEGIAVAEIGTPDLSEHIDSVLDCYRGRVPIAPKDDSPIAYEQYCGDLLAMAGWQVSSTPYTGDQGADLIAKKYGRTVVVQCKQYSRSVGNKAVQEANAAKLHYGADAAVVVSNMAYTRSAQELAGTTNVLLLHHEQLPEL